MSGGPSEITTSPVPARHRFRAPEGTPPGNETDRGFGREISGAETEPRERFASEQADDYVHQNGRHHAAAESWGPKKRES